MASAERGRELEIMTALEHAQVRTAVLFGFIVSQSPQAGWTPCAFIYLKKSAERDAF
jgi:hypothetical protein